MLSIREKLIKGQKLEKLPKITVFNRIDGPGSSLDLRMFQMSMWSLRKIPKNRLKDPAMKWSIGLPRTLGITISVGTEIWAEPAPKGQLGVTSIDYGFSYLLKRGEIPPKKEMWLMKIMETFNLDGVRIITKNLFPDLKSAALGGSASVTTGVAILANELTGKPFNYDQIVGMAGLLENDLGVSITGTQEQANVAYGGVTEYIWFPWGIPGEKNFYGTSIRQEILKKKDYQKLRNRLDLYFLMERFSADVNSVWLKELKSREGYKLHKQKCELAYHYREYIRKGNWSKVVKPIREYREIRTRLCPDYMSKPAWEIEDICKKYGATSFPVGGGGGSTMVYSPDPKNLIKIRNILKYKYRNIDYKILDKGYKIENINNYK